MNRYLACALAPLVILTSGCVSLSQRVEEAVAPQPANSIDTTRFYSGRWYEIARTSTKLNQDCVAGTIDFYKGADGQMVDKDACREGSPAGKEKALEGPITLLNSDNTKMRVDYKALGVFASPRTRWILDHDETYGWFIVSDPNFRTVALFSRNARPSPSEVAMLNGKAKALGYDIAKLEYPAQFPVGQP
jgi:apolipoprotein D and lipocalin family protein